MSNDEIIRLIAKIRDRYNQMHESSGDIARIEVDLLQADIRELYERISLLRLPQPGGFVPESEKSQPEIRVEETPPMVETVSESESTPGPLSQEHQEPQAPEASLSEASFSAEPLGMDEGEEHVPAPPVPAPAPTVYAQVPVPEPDIEIETPGQVVHPEMQPKQVQNSDITPQIHETHTPVHSTLDLFGAPSQTLADKFRNEKRSISEKFGVETSADKSLGSKLRLKITDLHSAIGINDRFIFINELFEGDMRMYDEMLGRLNTCNSLEQALEVFNHAKSTQGWSDELSSVERLLDFIHRRYA